MASFIVAIVLLVLALGGEVIRKTYYEIPAHELKRRAAAGDARASILYKAVAYGGSLRILLWAWILIMSAAGIVLLARDVPLWVSIIAAVMLLGVVYSWLPAARSGGFGTRLTLWVTPLIVGTLERLRPILQPIDSVLHKKSAHAHTGLFERSDLLGLIERQAKQADNRLGSEELEIARRALNFGDVTVRQVLTPAAKIKIVKPDATVGPVLIDELHKNGQTFALVREKPKGPFTGYLAVKQLGLHSHGQVRDLMNPTIYYLHERGSLSEALHAFFVTNCPLFVVVDSHEKYVGVITIESVLQELLGHVPGDNFDQYANLTAVAARH